MRRFKIHFSVIALLSMALAGCGQNGPTTSSAPTRQTKAFPALESFHLEGNLPDRKGKVVLIDFWASWCGPCKSSFPAMEALNKEYAGKGLVIIGVNVDENRADMERFLKPRNVSFAIVRDAEQKLVAAADVSSMPTSFVLDRSGTVRYTHTGFRGDETVKQYHEEIDSLLKEPTP